MKEQKEDREEERSGFNRRKLLAGGLVAAPTLALLHETVPAPGPPRRPRRRPAPGGRSGSERRRSRRHGIPAHANGLGTAGPTFRGGAAVDHRANGFNPTEILRDFDYGKTRRLASGRLLREWTLVASDKEIEVAPGVKFPAWTYNGRIPGPTLRCTEGDLLRIRFVNGSEHPHTVHTHGLHPAAMDGIPGCRRRDHRAGQVDHL